jgi:hypothetical protein
LWDERTALWERLVEFRAAVNRDDLAQARALLNLDFSERCADCGELYRRLPPRPAEVA